MIAVVTKPEKIVAPAQVAIIVLNWNGKADTIPCLESLRKLSYSNYRALVVDNGSTDDSVQAIRASHPWAEVLQTGVNLGYAGGNNIGMKHAIDSGADFVLVLNNDTEVAPDLLERLVDAASRHPAYGVFGPRIYYHHDPERIWFAGGVRSEDGLSFAWPGQGERESEFNAKECDTDYVCGAALFFRAEVARKIGYFDEQFFLVYEESDWCFRARRAGFGCRMIPSAKVWHKIGASFGSEASPLRTYFSSRNILLWNKKNLPRSLRRKQWMRVLRRVIPQPALSSSSNAPLIKRLIWAARSYPRLVSSRMSDPCERAYRLGVRDFLLGRFGDCPDEVRELSRSWAKRQKAINE